MNSSGKIRLSPCKHHLIRKIYEEKKNYLQMDDGTRDILWTITFIYGNYFFGISYYFPGVLCQCLHLHFNGAKQDCMYDIFGIIKSS